MPTEPAATAPSNLKLGSGCIVCEDSDIVGDVTLGNGTIVHPRARILAESGPIVIGECNLIEENASIINRGGAPGAATVIGNYNVFEVGSRCEAPKVGNNNTLEMKCVVGRDVELTNGCVIGASCRLTYPQTLPENCAVYGAECKRRTTQGQQPHLLSQMDFLSRVLPMYHNTIRKSN